MLPWQEEQLRREAMDRQAGVRCACCDDPIYTENCLDLSVIRLPGFLCQRCVDRNMLLTIDARED